MSNYFDHLLSKQQTAIDATTEVLNARRFADVDDRLRWAGSVKKTAVARLVSGVEVESAARGILVARLSAFRRRGRVRYRQTSVDVTVLIDVPRH